MSSPVRWPTIVAEHWKHRRMSNLNTRTRLLREIEEHRHSKVVLYATGDRSGLETRIGQDVIDLFVDHLDEIGPVPKISLQRRGRPQGKGAAGPLRQSPSVSLGPDFPV